jgi:CTP:molybdopterin cytidylyltransferase MocA
MFSIILAAGKGTRMGPTDRPKVCLDLDGVPVIVRAMETYTRCGIEPHVVVVGDRADQVAATVCERFPHTIFAYQREQRGTGDAARCGAAVLDAFGYQGDVLVVVGDRVLRERAVRGLLDRFRGSGADLCITVAAKEDCPDAGRVIEDEAGNILANVERSDAVRAQLIGRWFDQVGRGPLDRDRLRAELLGAFPTERKAQRAMPALWQRLDAHVTIAEDDLRACFSPDEAFFSFEGPDGEVCRLSGNEIETHTRHVNLSIYCFRAEALRYALERLTRANAQGEEYLTDAIGILAAARTPDGRPCFRVVAYPIVEPGDAVTFNTPEELRALREQYGRG